MISVVLRSPLPGTYVTVKFPILSSPTAFSIPPTFHEPSIRNAALSFVNNWNVSSSFAVNVLSGKYPFSYNVLISPKPLTHAFPAASSTFFGSVACVAGESKL